jgi:hypothetical protein
LRKESAKDVKGHSSSVVGGELKIKGQAEAERKKDKWDPEDDVSPSSFLL